MIGRGKNQTESVLGEGNVLDKSALGKDQTVCVLLDCIRCDCTRRECIRGIWIQV